MEEIILQVDRLLAMLEVRGNSVIILADARKALGEAYKIAAEKNKEAAEKEGASAGPQDTLGRETP